MHRRKDMTVRVERDRYRGMSQHLGHLLRVHVATEQQARGSMAKIVEPNHRKPPDCEKRPQFAIESNGVQVTARCSAEHEIAIDPECSRVETLFDLVSSMLAKRVDSKGSDLDTAPRPS